MNSSVYVASPVKHKNDQEAITFFVPTQAGSQQAIHGLFDLMGDMELFNSYDQLILALQGLGYSSKQNDTKSFCLNPSLMRNDPSNAKLFAPFDKLKGAGVKKITLNCKGDRTGKHTDDIASHKGGERPSSGPRPQVLLASRYRSLTPLLSLRLQELYVSYFNTQKDLPGYLLTVSIIRPSNSPA